MRLRTIVAVIIVLSIPFFLFLNAWQGYRYGRLVREIERLDDEQRAWLERNKKTIAGIAVYSSPGRIETSAREELHLRKVKSTEILKIHVTGDEAGDEQERRHGR